MKLNMSIKKQSTTISNCECPTALPQTTYWNKFSLTNTFVDLLQLSIRSSTERWKLAQKPPDTRLLFVRGQSGRVCDIEIDKLKKGRTLIIIYPTVVKRGDDMRGTRLYILPKDGEREVEFVKRERGSSVTVVISAVIWIRMICFNCWRYLSVIG